MNGEENRQNVGPKLGMDPNHGMPSRNYRGNSGVAFQARGKLQPWDLGRGKVPSWIVTAVLVGVTGVGLFLLLDHRARIEEARKEVLLAEAVKQAERPIANPPREEPVAKSVEKAVSVDGLRAQATGLMAAGDVQGVWDLYARVEEFGVLPEEKRAQAEFYFDAGSAALLAGYSEKALSLFQKSVSLDPGFKKGNALNNCAFLLFKEQGDLKEARVYIDRALAIAPETPEFLDTLANIEFAEGDAEGALKTMRKAEKLSVNLPSHPQICESLGDLSLATGNREEALRYWREAVVENPGNNGLWQKIADHSE